MTELMQALLDYGKPARFEMDPHEIAAAVDGAVELCRPLAERQGIVLTALACTAGPPVLMDLHQLTQALENVVENAVQHSPYGGRVSIETAPLTAEGSPWVRVAVRDEGPGFAPADLPRAVEPFFSRRSGGTGLGLSIVSRVVEGHGGRLRAANHPEGGAVIELELPCLARAEAH